MAVTQNPFIGKSKQKVANVVLSTWKGINTMRSKPLEVANPRTPAQVAQRDKMSSIVRYARQAKQAIDLGFVEQAIRQSQYNAFVGTNIRKFTTAPYLVTNATEFAKGSLSKPRLATYVDAGGFIYDFVWDSNLQPGENPTDKAIIVLWSEDTNVLYSYITSNERQDGGASITVSEESIGNTKAFLFFCSTDFRKASDSVNCTEI